MTPFQSFLAQVGLTLGAIGAVGAYPLYRYAGVEGVHAAAVGCGMCTANVVVGCYLAVWSLDKPQAVFLKALMGGTALRLMLMGVAFFLLVKFTQIHISALTGSMFLFYVLFQIIEIRFLVKNLSSN